MVPQTIINIPEICYQLGVRDVVLSPGSRSAPLTISFARYKNINKIVIPDERSAGFIALGIALKSKKPVVVICTSGSAVYNLAPAVAEAYFQQIPILIFSADRPPEWIGQFDGQTIYQKEIFGEHVKKFFQFPDNHEHTDSKWFGTRIICEAINTSVSDIQGPVHVNFPFREPFYPEHNSPFKPEKDLQVIRSIPGKSFLEKTELKELSEVFNTTKRVLIIGGQSSLDHSMIDVLSDLSNKHNISIVGDCISNLHGIPQTARHTENYLNQNEDIDSLLVPDLLITFGKSVISKNLKLFLRKANINQHWHIQESGQAVDTFQSLSKQIKCDPEYLFKQLLDSKYELHLKRDEYQSKWKRLEEKSESNFKGSYFNHFTQLESVRIILSQLPESADLHLANSMPVRWVDLSGISSDKNEVEVFCNRGTSGIDGSVSTSLGNSLVSDRLTILITGDLAFFYDRNAWWNNYPKENLRVIILNNHSGGIFGLIKGPSDQPELEEYFETRQDSTAGFTAQEHGLEYHKCKKTDDLKKTLNSFFEKSSKGKILELEFDNKVDKKEFKDFRRQYINAIQKMSL